jgi:hypothetical protein
MRPLINVSDERYWPLKQSQPFARNASRCNLSLFDLNSSTDSQLELSSLQIYVDSCQEAVRDIRLAIEFLGGEASDHEILQRIVKKLGKFCLDADGWQFDDLYQIAFAIQTQLADLELGIKTWDSVLAKTIDEGLNLLSVLLKQCESDYRHQRSVSDWLVQLSQPA